jgi:carbonic anhydrase
MAGNERFVTEKRTNRHQNRERLLEVVKGQNPFAAVLGCADSRVPVEIVFDQGLGDIFVCRVAGNIVTPEEAGSLEFGTLILGAKVLVVMGHSDCGAVKAAITGGELPGQIGSLIRRIETGPIPVSATASTLLDQAIKTNVLAQVARLNQSPVIGELVDKKQLKVVGSFYDLDTGKVIWLS